MSIDGNTNWLRDATREQENATAAYASDSRNSRLTMSVESGPIALRCARSPLHPLTESFVIAFRL